MTVERLRILVLSPAMPARWWGFGTRVLHLVKHLAEGHDVTVLTYAGPDDAPDLEELQQLGVAVHRVCRQPVRRRARRLEQLVSLVAREPFAVRSVHSDAMQDALDVLVSSRAFDVVLVESSQMGGFRLPLDLPVVLDEHNVEYELLSRMQAGEQSRLRRFFNGVEQRKFRDHEHRLWREVDGIAVTSEREVPIVSQHAHATPVAVVPNAVDLDYFRPATTETTPGALVFTGLLTYRPNLDAVTYFVDEVLPLVRQRHPDVELTVIGRGEDRDLAWLRERGVAVTGRVPDIRPRVADGAVVVVPLRIGGGTRLKVVEALAMGKAIVSTSLGWEGIDVRNGEHLLTADDPVSFADAVVALLEDDHEARRLGQAARALAVDRYSWDRAGESLDALIRAAHQTWPVTDRGRRERSYAGRP
jgi:sugar transferase (PEP-CTERM/EpsH1 system associated)